VIEGLVDIEYDVGQSNLRIMLDNCYAEEVFEDFLGKRVCITIEEAPDDKRR